MLVPAFERSALVTDSPQLAAKVSALFSRTGRYFPVVEGPRMARVDADNEVVRCRNAIVRSGVQQILLGGMPPLAIAATSSGFTNCTVSDEYHEHLQALRGTVAAPKGFLRWGPEHLGMGVYQARLERKGLLLDLEFSPVLQMLEAGTHLLVACERGNSLAEVIASNLAFACGASFATFPELSKENVDSWLEEMYALGEGGNVTGRFAELARRARSHLGTLDFNRYKTVLFITNRFPWGGAVPEVASTHMYRYPTFGRAVIEGMAASRSACNSARTALLVDPHTVEGSEIPRINRALINNGTLTRVLSGPSATQTKVQLLLDLLPHDIIVLSTHAGDAPGERVTYEYPDADGRERRLVVDLALGIGHDPSNDKFRVSEYHRFHSLDGVDWRDEARKAMLPVGTALTTWMEMDLEARSTYVVERHSIPRVIGSMAIQLSDGIWLFTSHGFSPESAPLFINNSCWSWHELSVRTTFAGARAYVGSLFPIMDVEAQRVGQALFGPNIAQELPRALWLAQRNIYGTSARRPYVMVGLPFVSIRPNVADSIAFANNAYVDGIVHWTDQARRSPHEDVRQNANRFARFLTEDFDCFRRTVRPGRRAVQRT